jgi:hypothetical protein
MLVKIKGKIEFSPEDVTRKHKSQSAWKRVAMIRTDCELDRYYSWFIKKRFNLELNRNLRGSHITFISDRLEKDIFNQASAIFNGKEIDFYIDLEPRSNAEHWWLRVYCPEAESIREVLGLTREPFFGFHLTLGHANDKNIAHSEYILRQCRMFELISNDPRKPFNEHDIKEFSV